MAKTAIYLFVPKSVNDSQRGVRLSRLSVALSPSLA